MKVLIHNSNFDLSILSSEYERHGYSHNDVPKINYIDTLELAREFLPIEVVISYSLENLMFVMGLDLNPHDSIDDCKIIFNLVQYLKSFIF